MTLALESDMSPLRLPYIYNIYAYMYTHIIMSHTNTEWCSILSYIFTTEEVRGNKKHCRCHTLCKTAISAQINTSYIGTQDAVQTQKRNTNTEGGKE